MGILLSVTAWAYMLPLGLAYATNTSISNAMGAGDAATAKRVFRAGIGSAVVLQSVIAMSMLLGGKKLIAIMCNGEETSLSVCAR